MVLGVLGKECKARKTLGELTGRLDGVSVEMLIVIIAVLAVARCHESHV